MKKLLMLVLLVGFLMIGCQDNNSVLEPNISVEQNSLAKNNKINKQSTTTDDVKSHYSQTLTIDGSKGGKIFIKHSWYNQNKQLVKLGAQLTIPKNAFKGKLTFDIIFDLENYSVELYPSPFTFDKPVLLNLLFSNVDLTGIDPDNFDFNYLDGESEILKYDYIDVDVQNGLLEVDGAQLHHFSRYGWTRTNR